MEPENQMPTSAETMLMINLIISALTLGCVIGLAAAIALGG